MMYFKLNLTPFYKLINRAYFTNLANFIGISLYMFSFLSHAATESQIQQIKQTAENYILETVTPPVGGKLTAKTARIDPRINATDCPEQLIASSKNDHNVRRNINVLVECPSDNWHVYVPVRLTTLLPMIVATRPMARGSVISASDISNQFIQLQGYRKKGFSQMNQIIGAKVKRSIRLGNVIEQNDICVVCRNQRVTIRAIKGGLTITTQGTSLQDGTTGEQVRVKNDKSQRIIKAIVTNIGEVTVTF